MKLFAILAAASLVLGVAGCNNNKTAPAAAKASPGAVNETKSGCCKDKANTSAGAVSDKTAACTAACKDKANAAECAKTCTDKGAAAPGAVSEKKSGCTKTGSGTGCPFSGAKDN